MKRWRQEKKQNGKWSYMKMRFGWQESWTRFFVVFDRVLPFFSSNFSLFLLYFFLLISFQLEEAAFTFFVHLASSSFVHCLSSLLPFSLSFLPLFFLVVLLLSFVFERKRRSQAVIFRMIMTTWSISWLRPLVIHIFLPFFIHIFLFFIHIFLPFLMKFFRWKGRLLFQYFTPIHVE